MATHRYTWRGVAETTLARVLDPAITSTLSATTTPAVTVDIELSAGAIAKDKEDLDAFMILEGWEFTLTF